MPQRGTQREQTSRISLPSRAGLGGAVPRGDAGSVMRESATCVWWECGGAERESLHLGISLTCLVLKLTR